MSGILRGVLLVASVFTAWIITVKIRKAKLKMGDAIFLMGLKIPFAIRTPIINIDKIVAIVDITYPQPILNANCPANM